MRAVPLMGSVHGLRRIILHTYFHAMLSTRHAYLSKWLEIYKVPRRKANDARGDVAQLCANRRSNLYPTNFTFPPIYDKMEEL